MGKDKKPKLSKKELRKLEEKALRKAEKKAAEKAAKKREAMGKATKKGKVDSAARPTESATDSATGVDSSERHPHLQHLDHVAALTAVLSDPSTKRKARAAAETELAQLREAGEKINAEKAPAAEKTIAEQDAEMKERIKAKRAQRDAEAAGKPGSEERLRKAQQKVADAQGVPGPEQVEAARAEKASTITLADVTPEPPAEDPVDADASALEAIAEASTAVEEPVEFAKPSEAPAVDFETNGLGQYKVKRPTDGKMVGYTRATTYISVLEDTTALTKWKMRILLEGVVAAETPDAEGKMDEPVTAKVRDLLHNRDLAIVKARKADRKGKLQPGQLATLIDGAWGDFKRALDRLADEVFEIGGGREAATKGTDIHALCELYDAEGMDAVQEKLEAGEITPADFADVEAYADACRRLGLKVVATEQVIVNDDLKVAGRLDRIYLAKLPEIRDPKTGEILRVADARAKRYVGDLKTGRVDYGQAKIAQQIRMYAESQAYDLDTHERTSHGANRTTGLLIHLPVGSAKATVHIVDLAAGGRGNKLAGEVRAFRNEGKKAINLKIDLLEIAAAEQADADTESGEEE